MRRLALLLAALLVLGCAVAAAEAKPRKRHRKLRGKVVAAKVVRLPSARTSPRRPDPRTAPSLPGTPTAPGTPPPSGDAPPLPPPPPPPAGTGRSVQVTSDDADPGALRLTLSRTTVLAGTVKITFNNGFAQDPHNLVLQGPGEPVVFDELAEGGVAVRSAALATGSWKVYCALEGHEAKGMRATLTVAAG